MGRKDIEKHQFKKGQTGNPNGRPKKTVSKTLEELKAEGYEGITPQQVKETYEVLVTLDEDKLKALIADKEQPMINRIVGREILNKKGFEIIEKMLDRAHGKATQKTEVTGEGGKELNFVVNVVLPENDKPLKPE